MESLLSFTFVSKAARNAWEVLLETVRAWRLDNGMRMAAALAFYTTFSFGPALLIAIGIAGALVGDSAARSEAVSNLEKFITPEAASYVFSVLERYWIEVTDKKLPVIGIAAALVASTAVFAELQSSLNTIWGVANTRHSGILSIIYQRLTAFILVVGIGLLLLFSVSVGAALSAVSVLFGGELLVVHKMIEGLNLISGVAMIPGLLVLAYKLIPDADVSWGEALVGSLVASLLLLLGRRLFGMYLSLSTLLSVYGAAGSLVVIMLWVYYSSQVFFFGAELTKVWAKRYRIREQTIEDISQAGTGGQN